MAKNVESVVFGGGCFWCIEAVFRRLKGVISVASGYAGGEGEPPTYHRVSTGTTGHAEVVEVVFDPRVIPFDVLLSVFFSSHDPTTRDRQGNDIGSQYRSVIFYTTDSQRTMIAETITSLQKTGVFSRPVVTEIAPLQHFYPAEAHHQEYYDRQPDAPYCRGVIEPKLEKLRKRYAAYVKE